ncbi:MAG: lycopene cyclase domain-containing protein [Fulvivirga sp.]
MKNLYLTLDIAAISIPLLASFYPKANFSKTWGRLGIAIAIPAIIFILWDVLFTKWGVWGFNERYLIGIDIINLPIEEWLFFICIPYACTFTYFSLNHLIKKDVLGPYQKSISWALIYFLLALAIFNHEKAYTATTFFLLAGFLLLHIYVWKSDYLGRFYLTFLFILIPFFIINGILTGTGIEDQVVWYDNAENLSIRLGTIPVEDTFYGMLLLMMNVTIYERLGAKNVS